MQKTSLKGEILYPDLREFIVTVASGNATSLIIEGSAGLGKSYAIISTLEELGIDYEHINTFTTPLGCYISLYNARNKLVVMDDLEGIMNNSVTRSILKGALWSSSADGKRWVAWNSTGKTLEKHGVPYKFCFSGSVIICMNSVTENPSWMPVFSRSLVYRLRLTSEEKATLLRKVLDKQTLPQDVKDEMYHILEQYVQLNLVDLRIIPKVIAFWKTANEKGLDWKPLLLRQLDVSPEHLLIYRVLNEIKNLPIEEQLNKWQELIGKSKASMYRWKKKFNIG